MSLILHHHPLSSYCWKVLIGLYEAGIAFEPRIVNLGDTGEREAFARLWPTAKIPLLEDTAAGRVVPETSIMLEYVDTRYRGAVALFPDDPEVRLEARLWDRVFDLYVNSLLGQLVRDHFRDDAAAKAATLAQIRAAYPLIDGHMRGRVFAAGEAFSIADCAAAPALFYATVVEPAAGEFPHLQAYLERLLDRPAVARAIEEAKPWFRHYPFNDRLPERWRAA